MSLLGLFVIAATTSLLNFSHASAQDCRPIENQLRLARREFALREKRLKDLRVPRDDVNRRQAELEPAIEAWNEMVIKLREEKKSYDDLLTSELESEDVFVARVRNKKEQEDTALATLRTELHKLRSQISESQRRGDTRKQIQRWEDRRKEKENELKIQHVRQIIYQKLLASVMEYGRAGLERERQVVSPLLEDLESNLQALKQELQDLRLSGVYLKAEIEQTEQYHKNQGGWIADLERWLMVCRNPAPPSFSGGSSYLPASGQEMVAGTMLYEQNGLLYYRPCYGLQCTEDLAWIELYKVVCKAKTGNSMVLGGVKEVYQIVFRLK